MSNVSKIASLSDQELKYLVNSSYSKAEICRKLKIPYGGQTTNAIKQRMSKLNLSFKPKCVHPRVKRNCPVCGKKFETYNGSRGEKITCSYSCSNTYFRSGTNNGMHQKSPTYRTICFSNWPKKCILCNESRIIEVHHLNGDHSDNSKDNLIPLCPTCHQLIHTKKYHNSIDLQIKAKLS